MGDNSDNECDLDLLVNCLMDDAGDVAKTDEAPLKSIDIDFVSLESNSQPLSKSQSEIKPEKSTEKSNGYSSDEDQDFFDRKQYTGFGEDIKQMLKQKENLQQERQLFKTDYPKSQPDSRSTNIMQKSTASAVKKPPVLPAKKPTNVPTNVYCDPIFGYAINKPLISSAELVSLMEGRRPVAITKLKTFLSAGKPSEDWVIAGVLTHKSPTKQTAKGDNFAIWKLSDMTMDMNTISLFMFKNAYKSLWKVAEGSVIGVLNPNVMENRDSKNEVAPLCVDNPARVMIMGTSRDMGQCKSKKKDGDQCKTIVNIRLCEYCVYHVKQQYSKHSKRSDLQSNFSSSGISMKGQTTAPKSQINKYKGPDPELLPIIPAKQSQAMISRDKNRLEQLKLNTSSKPIVKREHNEEVKEKARMVELTSNQSKKDAERLRRLKELEGLSVKKPVTPEVKKVKVENVDKVEPQRGRSALSIAVMNVKPTRSNLGKVNSTESLISSQNSDSPKSKPLSVRSLMTPKSDMSFSLDNLGKSPKVGLGCSGGFIDLSVPISKKRADIAKQNALEWIKKNGPIKANSSKNKNNSLKRKREEDEEEKNKMDKESFAEKFRKLMETKSSHTELQEKAEAAEEEKYFNKMETKDRMEQKMLSTMQVECKAVICKVCKYTAFSASELCKSQRHPLKVIDAMKRFYKCGNCGNRTTTLDRIPSTSCTRCDSSSWVRIAMMDEKRTEVKTSNLSVRGDEEKYYGNASGGNLNLVLPD